METLLEQSPSACSFSFQTSSPYFHTPLTFACQQPYIHMQIIGGKYTLGSVIGSGSFGRVHADGDFAIKQIKLPSSSSRQRQPLSLLLANEIRILTQLNHPHIVKVYEVIEHPQAVFIVMERCEGDLRSLTEIGCGVKKAVVLLRQIVSGYSELARQGIVHRDLKPANILLRRGVAKLADFGMAKYVANEGFLLRSHVGTPYYMAPQLLQRIEYSRKCDIWSLGVIFYQLVFGRLPWQGKNQAALLQDIMNRPLSFPMAVSPSIQEILTRMLAMSQGQRLSLQELQKLLELYEQGEKQREEKSYHWTLVRKLMLHEAEHRSLLQFHKSLATLSEKQGKEVQGEVGSLLREQQGYLLQYLPIWRQK